MSLIKDLLKARDVALEEAHADTKKMEVAEVKRREALKKKVPIYVNHLMRMFLDQVKKDKHALIDKKYLFRFNTSDSITRPGDKQEWIEQELMPFVVDAFSKELFKNEINVVGSKTSYFEGSHDIDMSGYGEGFYCEMQLRWG